MASRRLVSVAWDGFQMAESYSKIVVIKVIYNSRKMERVFQAAFCPCFINEVCWCKLFPTGKNPLTVGLSCTSFPWHWYPGEKEKHTMLLHGYEGTLFCRLLSSRLVSFRVISFHVIIISSVSAKWRWGRRSLDMLPCQPADLRYDSMTLPYKRSYWHLETAVDLSSHVYRLS